MLKIACKATGYQLQGFQIGGLDSRSIWRFDPMVLENEEYQTFDIDSFEQGERYGAYTNLHHHKFEGRLEIPDLNLTDQFDHTWTCYDYYGDLCTSTFHVEHKDGYTAYMVHDYWPNWYGKGQPESWSGGIAFRLVHYYWGDQLVAYHPKVVASPMPYAPPTNDGWDAADGWSYSYSVTGSVIGEDLDEKQRDQLAIFIRNICDAEVSNDRQNLEAIHDTVIRDMVDDVMTYDSVNNIANAVEVLKLAHAVVSGEWSDLFKLIDADKSLTSNLGSTWLKYRYVYNTTKADVHEELTRLARELPDNTPVEGRSGKTVGNTSYHATCLAQNKQYTAVRDKILNGMKKLGVYPSWANIWDLVPFSFMVDWFVPFADFAEQCRINDEILQSSSGQGSLDFLCYCFSCKTVKRVSVSYLGLTGSVSLSYYDREAGHYPTVSSEIAWYREDTSNLTWSKRLLDGVSMLAS